MTSFMELEKAILKFKWTHKESSVAKTIFSTMNKAGGIKLPTLKINNKAIEIKTSWY